MDDTATRILTQFGRNVRSEREASAMSLAELASPVGLDRAVIDGIERGSYEPTMLELLGLARALAVPPPKLVAGI